MPQDCGKTRLWQKQCTSFAGFAVVDNVFGDALSRRLLDEIKASAILLLTGIENGRKSLINGRLECVS